MVDWNFAISILPKLLRASVITIEATVAGMSVALVTGLLLALGRRSKNRVLSLPVGSFIEFIRATPLLVQLYHVRG
jgi:polar amino acid transport system permease protein